MALVVALVQSATWGPNKHSAYYDYQKLPKYSRPSRSTTVSGGLSYVAAAAAGTIPIRSAPKSVWWRLRRSEPRGQDNEPVKQADKKKPSSTEFMLRISGINNAIGTCMPLLAFYSGGTIYNILLLYRPLATHVRDCMRLKRTSCYCYGLDWIVNTRGNSSASHAHLPERSREHETIFVYAAVVVRCMSYSGDCTIGQAGT